MGHNVSDRKRRAFVLSATLADMREWVLVAECAGCCHRRTIPVADLLAAYRRDIRIQELLPRLRCSQQPCRGQPGRVAMARIAEEIVLLGPGAYG